MKYIVYCTTCLVNGKVYIGVHKTEDPNKFDKYIGNGIEVGYTINNPTTAFQRALKKYGYSNFKRSILYVFDNEDDAYSKEAEIVNIDFIKRRDNYNTALGGRHPGNKYKTIYQYDLQGNYLGEWFGIQETCKHFNCYDNRFNIAIKDKRSAFNSYWSYNKFDKLNIAEYRISQHSEVYQYNLNGDLLKIYSSASEVCLENPQFTINTITQAKYNKYPTGGYYFVSGDINIIDVIKTRELYSSLTDKSVSKYKDGKRICTYSSLSQAAKQNKISSNVIKKSIKNNEGIWSYGYSEIYQNSIEPISLKIDQFDLDGNFIKTWDSLSQCRKEFPKVRDVLNGTRKHTHGYVFKLS